MTRIETVSISLKTFPNLANDTNSIWNDRSITGFQRTFQHWHRLWQPEPKFPFPCRPISRCGKCWESHCVSLPRTCASFHPFSRIVWLLQWSSKSLSIDDRPYCLWYSRFHEMEVGCCFREKRPKCFQIFWRVLGAMWSTCPVPYFYRLLLMWRSYVLLCSLLLLHFTGTEDDVLSADSIDYPPALRVRTWLQYNFCFILKHYKFLYRPTWQKFSTEFILSVISHKVHSLFAIVGLLPWSFSFERYH